MVFSVEGGWFWGVKFKEISTPWRIHGIGIIIAYLHTIYHKNQPFTQDHENYTNLSGFAGFLKYQKEKFWNFSRPNVISSTTHKETAETNITSRCWERGNLMKIMREKNPWLYTPTTDLVHPFVCLNIFLLKRHNYCNQIVWIIFVVVFQISQQNKTPLELCCGLQHPLFFCFVFFLRGIPWRLETALKPAIFWLNTVRQQFDYIQSNFGDAKTSNSATKNMGHYGDMDYLYNL